MSNIRQPGEFDALYRAGGWDGKGSGPGSTEAFTRRFREVFEKLLADLKITSIFDLGCGDWQWQQHVKWPGLAYTGWDVSDTAIKAARHEVLNHLTLPYSKATVKQLDAFSEPLWPEADLLLIKDIVHHLTRFRVRRLIEKARLYDYVLWVVDMEKMSPSDSLHFPCNWPGNVMEGGVVYEFDTRVENYPYGPKHAILRKNP